MSDSHEALPDRRQKVTTHMQVGKNSRSTRSLGGGVGSAMIIKEAASPVQVEHRASPLETKSEHIDHCARSRSGYVPWYTPRGVTNHYLQPRAGHLVCSRSARQPQIESAGWYRELRLGHGLGSASAQPRRGCSDIVPRSAEIAPLTPPGSPSRRHARARAAGSAAPRPAPGRPLAKLVPPPSPATAVASFSCRTQLTRGEKVRHSVWVRCGKCG